MTTAASHSGDDVSIAHGLVLTVLRRIDPEFPASLLPLNFGRVLDRLYHLVPAHHLRPHSVCPVYRRKFLRGLAQFFPSSLGSLRSLLLVRCSFHSFC